ncbi:39953_t:CDS:2 [Gigaspora margarita]|uniref:39953_t:CDS:1 n=1 Tax=Gigaspora margarita TaxID=4874 RepID=A0ABN7V5G2_GIGMA|nr:39953_t:CDS:2 [Gigaspora margarita]
MGLQSIPIPLFFPRSKTSRNGQVNTFKDLKFERQVENYFTMQDLDDILSCYKNGVTVRGSNELMQIEIVQRKVKALNKLELEKKKFDSISDLIIEYAIKSRLERDGYILKEIIMEKIDPEIVDENVTNLDGKFVHGGTLFRKYLLNRCQEDFEKKLEGN